MANGLTHEEILIACHNIGINLDCGGCAGNFYTGHNDIPHDGHCSRRITLNEDQITQCRIAATGASHEIEGLISIIEVLAKIKIVPYA